MTNKFKPKPGTAKVQYVVAQLRPPTDSNPQGVTTEGWYTVIGGELSLVDRSGSPLRDGQGKTYTRQLQKDDDSRRIAGRLLKDFHYATHANKTNFNRTLTYSKMGLA
jgi:hypothetical protein